MLKRCVASVLISAMLVSTAYSDGKPPIPAPDQEIRIENIVAPRSPLSSNWVFVVDTSSSLWSIFGRVRASFMAATQHPTDELFFSAITFNDRGMEKFRDWTESSQQELVKAEEWVTKNRGVLSYGIPAIRRALEQRRDPLTIILITDGGFTEASYNKGFGSVRDAIFAAQRWRESQNLPKAQICSIGIENEGYTAGGKPSDADCQNFLREIGTTHGGGYYLIKGASSYARGRSR